MTNPNRANAVLDPPMSVIDAIHMRRAVKLFAPNMPISNDEIRELIESAMLSPTAFNLQHCRFVQIQDTAVREKIRVLSFYQPQITDASALILVCMDLKAWNKDPEQYWPHAPEQFRESIVKSIGGFYRDNPVTERDEAFRSCGLAAMSLMLAAQSKGYDSCPMVGADFDAIGKLVEIPDDHIIGLMITIGYRREDPWPRGGRLPFNSVFHIDRFRTPIETAEVAG